MSFLQGGMLLLMTSSIRSAKAFYLEVPSITGKQHHHTPSPPPPRHQRRRATQCAWQCAIGTLTAEADSWLDSHDSGIDKVQTECSLSVLSRRKLLSTTAGLAGGFVLLGQPSPPAATAAEAPPEEGILTGAGAEKFANAMSSEGAKVYERRIATQKEELFRALDDSCSNVLEIGIGSGPNLPYYSGSVKKLTGLDPNPFMLEKLATGACKKQTSAGVVPTLVGGVGESLPFADASFDAVVSTLVLCSVTDPEKVLSEIGRVLKPGGRYLFMEHVRAEAAEDGSDGDGAAKLLAAAQDAADPMQVKMAAGCHLNRRTGDQILNSEAFERIAPMKHFSAMGDRGEQFLISPHVMGVAWKKKEAA